MRGLRGALGATLVVLLAGVPSVARAAEVAADQVTLEEGRTEGQARHTPWAGSWWSQAKGQLSTGWHGEPVYTYDEAHDAFDLRPAVADDDLSPLAKYDRFVQRRHGADPGAAVAELRAHHVYGKKKKRLDEEGQSYGWWGHCNGWAAASIMEREPIGPAEVEGIRFDLADLKGLLTESYYGCSSTFSGRRYRAPSAREREAYETAKRLLDRPEADLEVYVAWYEKAMGGTVSASVRRRLGSPKAFTKELNRYVANHDEQFTRAYEDIDPGVFHRILVTAIGRQGKGVVFDTTAGEEVWNYPAYAYETEVARAGTESGGRMRWSVETTVHYADDGVAEAHIGTESFTKTYTYELVTDGAGRIREGTWTGRSVDEHPDFAWQPVGNAETSDGEIGELEFRKVKEIIAEVHDGAAAIGLTVRVHVPEGEAVRSTARREATDPRTIARPVAVGRSVWVSVEVAPALADRVARVVYRRLAGRLRDAGGTLEPGYRHLADGEGAAVSHRALLTLEGRGKELIVAQALSADGRLLAEDEITLAYRAEIAAAPATPPADTVAPPRPVAPATATGNGGTGISRPLTRVDRIRAGLRNAYDSVGRFASTIFGRQPAHAPAPAPAVTTTPAPDRPANFSRATTTAAEGDRAEAALSAAPERNAGSFLDRLRARVLSWWITRG